jgi:hypothetical protein
VASEEQYWIQRTSGFPGLFRELGTAEAFTGDGPFLCKSPIGGMLWAPEIANAAVCQEERLTYAQRYF